MRRYSKPKRIAQSFMDILDARKLKFGENNVEASDNVVRIIQDIEKTIGISVKDIPVNVKKEPIIKPKHNLLRL